MSEPKQWTVMFYFASDNPLAPGVISQLKAIKQAGFHPEANVIVQFDPQTVGTPTHVFDVNIINKIKSNGVPNVGFAGNDPFVRNIVEDRLWRDQKNRCDKPLRDELKDVLKERHVSYNPPIPPDDTAADVPPRTGRSRELPPRQSLDNFLKFCVSNYPARHYILFILGHGVVVGNDIFLFDEHTNEQTRSLSLSELGAVLREFRGLVDGQEVDGERAEFEMVGFHSCSVSSLEVAYELKGTAKYMLASQGPSFVGSWPYRQILIRLFNDIIRGCDRKNVKPMLLKIFSYCLHNSTDFLLAGYSYDLCLCNLERIVDIRLPLRRLTIVLRKGLKFPHIRNLILLAHWRSQSFWQESYTDLYDFCFCLRRLCEEYLCLNEPEGDIKCELKNIQRECTNVIDVLEEEDCDGKPEKIVTTAAFAGPAYQYSHGLSVFFPWSQPAKDTQILQEYKEYRFTETCWLKFLEEYFVATIRETRKDEEDYEKGRKKARAEAVKDNRLFDLCAFDKSWREKPQKNKPKADPCESLEAADADEIKPEASADCREGISPKDRLARLLEDIASLVYYDEGQTSNPYALERPKTDPRDPTGDEGPCGTIKNYPRDTRRRARRLAEAANKEGAIPLSENFLRGFEPPERRDDE